MPVSFEVAPLLTTTIVPAAVALRLELAEVDCLRKFTVARPLPTFCPLFLNFGESVESNGWRLVSVALIDER